MRTPQRFLPRTACRRLIRSPECRPQGWRTHPAWIPTYCPWKGRSAQTGRPRSLAASGRWLSAPLPQRPLRQETDCCYSAQMAGTRARQRPTRSLRSTIAWSVPFSSRASWGEAHASSSHPSARCSLHPGGPRQVNSTRFEVLACLWLSATCQSCAQEPRKSRQLLARQAPQATETVAGVVDHRPGGYTSPADGRWVR
jgi:hypothetical protein